MEVTIAVPCDLKLDFVSGKTVFMCEFFLISLTKLSSKSVFSVRKRVKISRWNSHLVWYKINEFHHELISGVVKVKPPPHPH